MNGSVTRRDKEYMPGECGGVIAGQGVYEGEQIELIRREALRGRRVVDDIGVRDKRVEKREPRERAARERGMKS